MRLDSVRITLTKSVYVDRQIALGTISGRTRPGPSPSGPQDGA
ncbi:MULTISPECIES: hypothetical protein [unclassified Streptomyces]|nr:MULTISPECIES: hypothetical protein [unclassified Streptomyces]MCX5335822.1 hypothetical protein [Streptomyces sp. NBC_00140]MCX5366538.1 hypothetical protein [Streptomyces sp. NBC_00124]